MIWEGINFEKNISSSSTHEIGLYIMRRTTIIVKELKGAFLRLINYIYIDDEPHKLQKMVRTFKAYQSSNEYIVS